MRKATRTACGSLLLAAATQAAAGTVDAKLLDMLLANGSITQAQHAELSADLKKDQRAEAKAAKEKLDKKEFTHFQQLAGWTATTKFSGDMRVREDVIDIEEAPGKADADRDRQRLRARLGVVSQVNPEIEVGIQVASGGSADRRSTNQDLDAYADKKPVWLDLGYIDYHPVAVPGLRGFAGKMKQPWMSTGDAIWDGDINPEGFAANYKKALGTTTLFGSGGYYVMKDNVDGEGVEWDHDLSLLQLQVGSALDLGANTRLTIGASLYDFNNESQGYGQADVALRANGNTTDRFSLLEGFGQLDVIGLPIPLSLYGQYVVNQDARDFVDSSSISAPVAYVDGGEDTAWLFGLRTNIAGIAFDYNYRDVEANGVVGYFTDSDFASGHTDSSGHKLKAQYDFMKNFNLTVTWFVTESSSIALPVEEDGSVDTLMVDLNAKF